eukprot:3971367-Prymnesium_polylepis.1
MCSEVVARLLGRERGIVSEQLRVRVPLPQLRTDRHVLGPHSVEFCAMRLELCVRLVVELPAAGGVHHTLLVQLRPQRIRSLHHATRSDDITIGNDSGILRCLHGSTQARLRVRGRG